MNDGVDIKVNLFIFSFDSRNLVLRELGPGIYGFQTTQK